MKSAYTIKMNFNQAKKQAEELEEISAGMKRLAHNGLEGSFRELSTAWRGEAADVFQGKGSCLIEKILEDARQLEKIAGAMRSSARRTYDAEMQAYNLAQTRLYNKK